MIDPKINIRSKPALSAQPESLIKDSAAITTIADSAVQARAYKLYEFRGKIDGRAEQDWYEAENDLRTSQQA